MSVFVGVCVCVCVCVYEGEGLVVGMPASDTGELKVERFQRVSTEVLNCGAKYLCTDSQCGARCVMNGYGVLLIKRTRRLLFCCRSNRP